MAKSCGPHYLYKGRFCIVFYDKNDEYLEYMFNNVREILRFQNKPTTSTNVNLVNVELYRALRSPTHITTFLNGQLLRVYTVDVLDDSEQE